MTVKYPSLYLIGVGQFGLIIIHLIKMEDTTLTLIHLLTVVQLVAGVLAILLLLLVETDFVAPVKVAILVPPTVAFVQ